MTTLFTRASVTVLVATGAAAMGLGLTTMAPAASNAAALVGQCQSGTTATAQPPRGSGATSAGASASVSPKPANNHRSCCLSRESRWPLETGSIRRAYRRRPLLTFGLEAGVCDGVWCPSLERLGLTRFDGQIDYAA